MKRGLINLKYYSLKKNEKDTAVFLLKLLLLLFSLKTFFYFYNEPVIGISTDLNGTAVFTLLKWSFRNDVMVLLLINTGYITLLSILSFWKKKRIPVIIFTAIFLLINFFCVLLNLVDVFYFHFHLQRADADLFYVLQHPLQKTFYRNPLVSMMGLISIAAVFYLVFLFHKKLFSRYYEGKRFVLSSILMIIFCFMLFYPGTKKIIPTYPLIEISSAALPLVQNSFHTFFYSVYRKQESMVYPFKYMPEEKAESLGGINKVLDCNAADSNRKNIVLFIMESVPEDFFHPAGKYKVAMPFLDSLLNRSTYFSNAFSYGRSSNKGITSILTGIPTLTEIPLYHSNYAGIDMTRVGDAVASKGYQSAFFIGDNYDDFGFAKCANWLGIQHYYSMEDIPGYQSMQKHTMGLQDEYVLDFMGIKINGMKQPFLAINYNISTHFPNDLPKDYREKYPLQNFSAEMKSMNYYNECLQLFFKKAAVQDWYKHTVFIFCSDHWMDPDAKKMSNDLVQSFHIPLFVFDPGNPQKQVISNPVSQLDIMNSILCIAGYDQPAISYGKNLLNENRDPGRVVYSKQNAFLYQAYDSSYVLGFNTVTGKAEYCYHYKTDLDRSNNLVKGNRDQKVDSLIIRMKAFLQSASNHYTKREKFQ